MDPSHTLPSCVLSNIFWFIPTPALSSWLSTCSSNAWISTRHPSWKSRTLQSFGAELVHQTTDWRQLFLCLARACHSAKEMSFAHFAEREDVGRLFIRQEEEEMSEDTSIIRRNFDLGNPSWDLELQLGIYARLCTVEFQGPSSFWEVKTAKCSCYLTCRSFGCIFQ
eukprot:Skav209519  [mRNA]  locus=scaffold2767:302378:303191:- [translate_table: standard]